MLERYHEQFQEVSCQPHRGPSEILRGREGRNVYFGTEISRWAGGLKPKTFCGRSVLIFWNNTLNSAKFSVPFKDLLVKVVEQGMSFSWFIFCLGYDHDFSNCTNVF